MQLIDFIYTWQLQNENILFIEFHALWQGVASF